MSGYIGNIEKLTLENDSFRQVLYTGQHSQLVVMSLLPNEAIGLEVHEVVDQFLRIEKGEAEVVLNGKAQRVKEGDAIIVPAGVEHTVVNLSTTEKLKLYTLYSPPHHKDGTTHKTKADALADEEDHL